jgi:hypothetical protein
MKLFELFCTTPALLSALRSVVVEFEVRVGRVKGEGGGTRPSATVVDDAGAFEDAE